MNVRGLSAVRPLRCIPVGHGKLLRAWLGAETVRCAALLRPLSLCYCLLVCTRTAVSVLSPRCHVILTPSPRSPPLFQLKMSFVMSIFVLGYKMTLLEKQARLQIRKWNLEARMDTDTMLNKKAARGRRYSWACQQCEVRVR